MTIFFAIILYIAGFYLLARRTVAGAVAPRNRITFLAVLFLVYSCIAAGFAIWAYQWRNPGLAMYAICLLFSLIEIGMIFLTLSHCNREIRSRHVILFLLYLFAILLVTLVTRRPRADVVLQTEMFASVKEFMVKGTVEDLNHMVLNIVMFMPLGYLFVQMHPQKLGDPAKVVGVGIMLSSVIETCQLIFRLGNCDMDDILANTIGIFLGWALFKIIHRHN